MASSRKIVFYKYVHGCTEDHELMSNYELQDHIEYYYGRRVCGNSSFQEFTLYCTDEIILDVLSYCCRFGYFRIHDSIPPKKRN